MKIAKTVYLLLPTGQADEISYNSLSEERMNIRKENLSKIPIYSTIWTIFITIFGIYLFNKKELK